MSLLPEKEEFSMKVHFKNRGRAVITLAAAMSLMLTTTPVVAQVNDPGFYRGAESPSKQAQLDKIPARTAPLHTQNPTEFPADCPPTVRCVVVPAAYIANDGNIEDYGNYDITNRPTDMKIESIIINDTEGDLQSVLDHFRDSRAYVSTQYVIAQDGTIYQMVQNKDMGWHAGNWWYNMHSIGIEHVGHAADSTSFTPAMYEASAKLVRYLTDKYSIPRDTSHIIGSDAVPAPTGARIPGMHVDPGPFWNWQHYLALIRGGLPIDPSADLFTSKFITVAPVWPLSKQPVTGCFPGVNPPSCVPEALQPTNFAYLRTEPKEDAPLFADPVLGQGSTDIKNSAARVLYGQKFAVATRKFTSEGIWYQVWVNGKPAWLHSPWKAPTAFPSSGKYVTPKPGKTTIPVYGRPSPEASAYPSGLLSAPPASFWIPTNAPTTPLPYTISAGQRYAVMNEAIVNDHFYAWSSTADQTLFPYDHTVFKGETKFIQVSMGSRHGFVKASDVDIR
jgi:hypothetical protein